MNRKMAFVSTCALDGWHEYGENFVTSFIEHFPENTVLYFYKDFKTRLQHPRVIYRNIELCDGLNRFQDRVARHGFATGSRIVHDTHVAAHDPKVIWNARKFSFKVFSVEDAVLNSDADVVTWLDADTIAFRDVASKVIEEMIPPYCMTSYLGRANLYSECGYVSYNRQHPWTESFVREFASLYRDGVVFGMKEWHDSYVYDVLRTAFENRYGIRNYNISHDEMSASHVFINSRIGLYLDHMKGGRKAEGSSRTGDLVVDHDIDYWKKKKKKKPAKPKAAEVSPADPATPEDAPGKPG